VAHAPLRALQQEPGEERMMQMTMVVFAVLALALTLAGCNLGADERAGAGGGTGAGTRAGAFERDTLATSGGELGIVFIGHGTLMFEWQGTTIHVDPYGKLADYPTLPDADLVLITHHHGDHMDLAALDAIRTEKTSVVLSAICARTVQGGIVMANGDEKTVAGVPIRAVPAYNIEHTRPSGEPFHPKGEGNGYVLTFGDKTVYVAGDTEDIPEMTQLKDIDVAFLPMNLPYTMTPEMAAAAARASMPKVVYPYHFGETDTGRLVSLLKDTPAIEVRVRKMK
jgi:L-ascorbate metabolism protein UlaG (beta-lactamase superfamily)